MKDSVSNGLGDGVGVLAKWSRRQLRRRIRRRSRSPGGLRLLHRWSVRTHSEQRRHMLSPTLLERRIPRTDKTVK